MWHRFKEWLLQNELKRERLVLRDILRIERAQNDKYLYEHKQMLEMQYACIKKQNEHLTGCIMDYVNLMPTQHFIVKNDADQPSRESETDDKA
jgi:hypothetical protein